MKKSSRKIWEQPWGYAEGFIVAAGIALVGVMLQIALGNINPFVFSYPINAIIGLLFVLLLILTGYLLKENRLIKWLSGVSATVSAIIVLLAVIVVMGFTPQYSEYASKQELQYNFLGKLGWFQMTTSWIFILLCFYLLTILGFTII